MSGVDRPIRTAVSGTVDRVLAPIDDPREPGGIVGVMHRGRTLHLAGYGLASLEADRPWSPTTRYDIASITKSMVAQAIVRMADEGTIDLEMDVRGLIPSLGGLPLPVSVRDALSMRSGIRADEQLAWMAGQNGWVDEPFLHDLVARQRSLQFAPGAWQIYSDSNYRILARVVASVRGRSFAETMRSLVFDPVGLDATSIEPYDWNVSPGMATYYLRSGDGWTRRPYGFESSGDGAVRTTMSDLLRWLRLTSHGDHAGVPSIARLAREGDARPSMPYRFGVVVDDYRGLERWHHTGASGTAYVHYPEPEVTIVAFFNRDDRSAAGSLDELSDAVLDLVVPGLDQDESHAVSHVAPGTWVDPATGFHVAVSSGGRLRVFGTPGRLRMLDGRLTADLGDGPRVAVDPDGPLRMDLGHGPTSFEPREPGAAPDDVAGRYRSADLDAVVSIVLHTDGSQLVLGRGSNRALRVGLTWYGDDVAVGAGLGIGVERAQGRVAAIALSTWGARRVRFDRRERGAG